MSNLLWKEVKLRKETKCGCCGNVLPKKTKAWSHLRWVIGNPFTDHFCLNCGQKIKDGGSFDDARAIMELIK